MRLHISFMFLLCGFSLAACGPTNGPSGGALRQPVVTTTPPLGPTPAQSGRAPAFDRYGNANYDPSGAYIGGHGVGTLVDNPDASTMGIPKVETPKIDMPDISKMNCTGSSGPNAGVMNCSSN